MAKFFVALLLFVMAATGIALLRHANEMPAFTDPGRADALRAWYLDRDQLQDTEELSRNWHAEMDSIRTSKWKYHDSGRGLIVLSLTIVGLASYLRFVRRESLQTLTSPKRAGTFILWGNGAIAALWIGACQTLAEDLGRGMFPSWGDTIAIPIGEMLIMFVFIALLLSVATYFTLRRRRLPEGLWIWDSASPIRMWLLAIGCAIVASVPSLLLIGEVLNGTYLGPLALLLALYLVLSMRAVLAASKKLDGRHWEESMQKDVPVSMKA